jgi:hypothetical protein
MRVGALASERPSKAFGTKNLEQDLGRLLKVRAASGPSLKKLKCRGGISCRRQVHLATAGNTPVLCPSLICPATSICCSIATNAWLVPQLLAVPCPCHPPP